MNENNQTILLLIFDYKFMVALKGTLQFSTNPVPDLQRDYLATSPPSSNFQESSFFTLAYACLDILNADAALDYNDKEHTVMP